MDKLEYERLDVLQKNILSKLAGWKGISEIKDVFLTFYLLCYLSTDRHSFEVPGDCNVERILGGGEKGINQRLMGALEKIEKNNPKALLGLGDFVNFTSPSWGTDSEWDGIVYRSLESLNSLELFSDREKISRLFESVLLYIAEHNVRAAGEYSSPVDVGRLLVGVLEPRVGESIYDPVCGSGSFLSSSASYVEASSGRGGLSRIAGQENNFNTWVMAKINMIIHGYESAEISHGDTLGDPANKTGNGEYEKFDVVMANPPFSLKSWRKSENDLCLDSRFKFGIPPASNGDYAFILHVVASLKETGRAGVVVPTGALFRGGVKKKFVKNL
ncbi:MAG: N-6 DNA methylase [Gammaproteobacteria bacterium]|nr:N-6 DNA methylase [Gammaproteobacteria bacterium]